MMSEDYGFWFHYLVGKTAGPWNSYGTRHASFSEVSAVAVSNELSYGAIRTKIMDWVVCAFVRKGSSEGFYRMIGGRQIVRDAVDDALFHECGATQCATRLKDRNWAEGDSTFEQALYRFAYIKDIVGMRIRFDLSGDLMYKMWKALRNGEFYGEDNGTSPYEWGNPTAHTNSSYPLFMDALRQGPIKEEDTSDNGIFWRNDILKGGPNANGYYPIFFVLTKNQLTNWCGGFSCAAD